MWLWLTATAKAHARPELIAEKRAQWAAEGKDRQLAARCRSAQRYVVEQRASPTVFWLLDTDDPNAVALITDHFGDLWDIQVSRVTPQALPQAVSRSAP